MMRPSPVTTWNTEPKTPRVHAGSFVDETAVVIGDVTIAEGTIVCPTAVLRADEGAPIEVGARTNIQDGVIMHCLMHSRIKIGDDVCIAHGAIVHGPCTLGDNCFIGFRATLLNAHLGKGCFVGHHALVLNVTIPDGKLVPPGHTVASQADVDQLPPVTDAQREFAHEVLKVNAELVRGYLKQQTE